MTVPARRASPTTPPTSSTTQPATRHDGRRRWLTPNTAVTDLLGIEGGAPNGAYGPASPGYEANNDEYVATLAVPNPAGDYDVAYRFSGDDDQTLTYCDGQGEGSSDGYNPANAGQMTSLDPGTPPVVFFSEYAEGSANNTALELYNADGADANMGTCALRFYFGGSTDAGTPISLAGLTIADGDVLVVCDNNTDPKVFDGCDVLANGSFYNGDDAIEVLCGGTTLDVIGQIGFDPGSSWSVGGAGTQNQTIRRDCSVTERDADGSDVFEPSIEWSSLALDDFSGFGSHICP